MKRYFSAALVADALSLGPHWVYNQEKLGRIYPEGIHQFTDPQSSYHPNRRAGELTHFGDQMVLLEKSIQDAGGFDTKAWKSGWLQGMADYDGYIDGATKQTLAAEGLSPSESNDLSGASRLAPILDQSISLQEAIDAARAQTGLTHGDLGVSDAAEFFVRAVYQLREGATIYQSFLAAAEEGSYAELDVASHLMTVREVLNDDFLKVSTDIGLTCHLPEAFPLTLFFALREGATFESSISDNGMAGGDTSARAMLLAVLFAARDGDVGAGFVDGLRGFGNRGIVVKPGSNHVDLEGSRGNLSGVLEMPEESPIAFALFAHCFTCGKDFMPGAKISRGLAKCGIATLRIDFSGVGKSGGDFRDTSFVTNLDDLKVAGQWLSEHFETPKLLVGHSLGGAAVLAAAGEFSSVKAVATIGAPFDPTHIRNLLGDAVAEIETSGSSEVVLAGRKFTIGKRFIRDLHDHNQEDVLNKLRDTEVLIMHAPSDDTVALENAGKIYSALKHPKSFVSLSGADHLLTNPGDAEYVAGLISHWAQRAMR
ncbi:alpha/beta fold hydrolase [Luteolibacter algae]|uniref:Alpha/beta fold hydrolase n=1 Tax=Luteolibacter algae TaxID=454151 RepID=A0ABW5D6S5_9BACT